MKYIIRVSVIVCMAVMFGHSSAFAQESSLKQLKLGIISEKSGERLREFVALVTYVADRVEGIDSGSVVVCQDVNEMISKIHHGEVDLVFETAFPIIKLQDEIGVIPALVLWKKGVRQYRTVFFVRADSPIRALDDLKGKIIAFENPGSTSAHAIPRAELLKNGLRVTSFEESTDDEAVKYIFAGQEKNQAFFVLQKKADVAAFNNNDWDELGEKVKADLRIIHETKPIIRYLGAFASQTPKAQREAISNALLAMSGDPKGKEILKKAFKIKKAEKLTDQDRESLEYVRSLVSFSN